MAQQFRFEDCVFKEETLLQMLLGCARRGGPAEAALACRALGLHALTLGSTEAAQRIFIDAVPTLRPASLTGKTPGVRAAAVDALGMLCFVGCEGPHEALETMGLLSRIFSSKGTW
jgi:hypothetical protein